MGARVAGGRGSEAKLAEGLDPGLRSPGEGARAKEARESLPPGPAKSRALTGADEMRLGDSARPLLLFAGPLVG